MKFDQEAQSILEQWRDEGSLKQGLDRGQEAGWALLALVTVGLRSASQAEAFETGRELAHACANDPASAWVVENISCLSYIVGFVDAYQVSMVLREYYVRCARKPICLPRRGVQKGMVQGLVTDWLRRTPTDHDQSARVVLLSVLATAYPCD
jgi:Rap1a immunity proteins